MKRTVRKACGSTSTPCPDVSYAILAKVCSVPSAFVPAMPNMRTTCAVWERWTNGLYESTLHRVVHQGSNYRYVEYMPLLLSLAYNLVSAYRKSLLRFLSEVCENQPHNVIRIPFFFEPNFNARVAPLPAALRLQKDSIQPAYAYQPHHPHVSYPHCHHQGEPAEALEQRLKELVLEDRASAPPSSASSDSSSVYSRSAKDFKDELSGAEDNESDRATMGSLSVRSSLSTVSNGTGTKKIYSPRTPYTPINHTHISYTPLSVEKHYDSVVYGEFLMKKVGNNFATGKGKYD